MEKIKKYEAFNRAVAAFGEWRTWNRWQHIAYGLVRGVPYAAMERCCNDIPDPYNISVALTKLGAWPVSTDAGERAARVEEVGELVVWVRKPVRGKRPRPANRLPVLAEGA